MNQNLKALLREANCLAEAIDCEGLHDGIDNVVDVAKARARLAEILIEICKLVSGGKLT